MSLTSGAKWVRRNAFERARRWASRRETEKQTDRTLVIIDMQDDFLYRQPEKDLIPVICKLVQYAIQNEWPIILVEYGKSCRTTKAILKAIGNYPNQALIIKNDMNGGPGVIKCINNKKTWSFNLLVCGVYGPQCVSATVGGLFNYSDLIEVDVVTDAVCPPYSSSSKEDVHGQQREREITTEEIGATAK